MTRQGNGKESLMSMLYISIECITNIPSGLEMYYPGEVGKHRWMEEFMCDGWMDVYHVKMNWEELQIWIECGLILQYSSHT